MRTWRRTSSASPQTSSTRITGSACRGLSRGARPGPEPGRGPPQGPHLVLVGGWQSATRRPGFAPGKWPHHRVKGRNGGPARTFLRRMPSRYPGRAKTFGPLPPRRLTKALASRGGASCAWCTIIAPEAQWEELRRSELRLRRGRGPDASDCVRGRPAAKACWAFHDCHVLAIRPGGCWRR